MSPMSPINPINLIILIGLIGLTESNHKSSRPAQKKLGDAYASPNGMKIL